MLAEAISARHRAIDIRFSTAPEPSEAGRDGLTLQRIFVLVNTISFQPMFGHIVAPRRTMR